MDKNIKSVSKAVFSAASLLSLFRRLFFDFMLFFAGFNNIRIINDGKKRRIPFGTHRNLNFFNFKTLAFR